MVCGGVLGGGLGLDVLNSGYTIVVQGLILCGIDVALRGLFGWE